MNITKVETTLTEIFTNEQEQVTLNFAGEASEFKIKIKVKTSEENFKCICRNQRYGYMELFAKKDSTEAQMRKLEDSEANIKIRQMSQTIQI